MLGREVVVRSSAQRPRADYDDAWLLACGARARGVMDVGANVGTTALLLLLRTSVQRIVLVEPNLEALLLAAETLLRNRLAQKACFVPLCASDEDEWCAEVGYGAWYLKEHVRLTQPEPIAHRGRCHLLVQPSDWEYPEWLRSIPQGAPVT